MDKKLLTPGPLTTSMTTKEAMLHDWGSRAQAFININNEIRTRLIKMIDGENDYECIPMQGSGTFAVESMISCLTSINSKMLILTSAYLLGATYIEKHFTLDKTLNGNDHYHSGDPVDFKTFSDKKKHILTPEFVLKSFKRIKKF